MSFGIKKACMIIFFGLLFNSLSIPIFEGFDESAQYSMFLESKIQIPNLGSSYIDKGVLDFPYPYADQNFNNLSYSTFFNKTKSNIPPLPKNKFLYSEELEYQPFNSIINWQAQHPPIFFIILSTAHEFLPKNMNFYQKFMTLRVLNICFVVSGIFIFFSILKNFFREDRIAYCALLYLLFFPMFWNQFSRLTPDSMCLFLISLVAYFTYLFLKREKLFYIFCSSLILSTGLVTKAFFLPITFVYIVGINHFFFNKDIGYKSKLNFCLLLPLFLPALYFVYRYNLNGQIIGSYEAYLLSQEGGFFNNIHNLNLKDIFRGAVLIPMGTFINPETWSLVRLPEFFLIPFILFYLYFLFNVKDYRFLKKDFFKYIILLFIILYIGLFWHAIVTQALHLNGNSPGWYLHIFMPLIVVFLLQLKFKKDRSMYLAYFVSYSAMYTIFLLICRSFFFAGCLSRSDGHYYQLDLGVCKGSLTNYIDNYNYLLGSYFFAFIYLFILIFCAFYIIKNRDLYIK
jgi:hypothetical protein